MLFKLSVECPDLQEIVREFRRLNHLLMHLVGPPKPSGLVQFTLTAEVDNMLHYSVSLPSLPAVPESADVVKGVLSLVLTAQDESVEERSIDTAPGQLSIDDVQIDQDVKVNGTFKFVDDAGNESSVVSIEEFTTKDTIAPPAPEGGVGFTLVSES